MRVGVFGGTFDPIHLGHLIMAEQCREQARLDQVVFVPAAVPPHKQMLMLTPFAQRMEMLELALSGHKLFRIESLEKDRPGPSYTVETLATLQRKYPADAFDFILGSDSLHDLAGWHQPQRILEMASLLVVERAGWPIFSAQELHAALQLADDFPLRHQVVAMPLITLSSRDIRRRVGEGRSVRYMIPRAVEAYIEEKGLYREQKNAAPIS